MTIDELEAKLKLLEEEIATLRLKSSPPNVHYVPQSWDSQVVYLGPHPNELLSQWRT
jgi:hypothetical protein